MPFSPQVGENLLVKSARCCCLCREYKGTKIEVHHIVPEANNGTDKEENGIPLCFDCHSDVQTYNDKHPRGRKFRPTELKRHRDEWFKLVSSGSVGNVQSKLDSEALDLIRFYSQCFDRPAFQDRFLQERSVEAFDKALSDTITAINTGCLMNREGQVLCSAKGKSYLHSVDYRNRMDEIVHLLSSMRRKYDSRVKAGEIWHGAEHNGQRMYCINNRELATWFDDKRTEVIGLINSLCEDEEIPTLKFPLE